MDNLGLWLLGARASLALMAATLSLLRWEGGRASCGTSRTNGLFSDMKFSKESNRRRTHTDLQIWRCSSRSQRGPGSDSSSLCSHPRSNAGPLQLELRYSALCCRNKQHLRELLPISTVNPHDERPKQLHDSSRFIPFT